MSLQRKGLGGCLCHTVEAKSCGLCGLTGLGKAYPRGVCVGPGVFPPSPKESFSLSL